MTINIFMHIYIGENAHWDIYAPPWQKHYTIFFFHFRCILLQISHQKCFFISISIPGRSGVKQKLDNFLSQVPDDPCETNSDNTVNSIAGAVLRCVLLAQWITWLTRDRCNPKVPSSIPAGGKDFP